MQELFDVVAQLRFAEEIFHHILTLLNGFDILEREEYPTAQESATHRTDCLVDDIEQTTSVIIHRSNQFETADSEAVESDVLLLFHTGNIPYMTYVGMLGLFEVVEDGSGSYKTALQVVHSETLHVLHSEMLQQFLFRGFIGKNPVFQFVSVILRTEITLKYILLSTLIEHLFRREVGKEFFDIISSTLGSKELTRRDIEECSSASTFAEISGSKEVILFRIEYVIVESHTRGDQFGNTSFHQFLGKFGIFKLVADSHTLSCTNQFRQVSVECMVRESCHRRTIIATTCSVAPLRKCNTQNLRCNHGIVAVGLVEVATAEQ